jgi:very-short-patch-repair endonuclease
VVAFSRLFRWEKVAEGRMRDRRDGFQNLFRLYTMAQQIPRILENARSLSHAETAAEIQLWEQLRNRRLCGHKFVRQLPIGHFIADFACRERKLIVEVDGATHCEVREVAYDARRTAILESQGWRIVRVTNDAAFNELNAVCDHIVWALEQ